MISKLKGSVVKARIGFDLHGVLKPYDKQLKSDFVHDLDEIRRIFVISFMRVLIQVMKYNDIIIVSGPPKEQILKELTELGYEKGAHFTDTISVVDYLKSSGVKMWQDEKQTWWASDEDWWSAKARICNDYNIKVMVDDNVGYKGYFDKLGIKFILFQ